MRIESLQHRTDFNVQFVSLILLFVHHLFEIKVFFSINLSSLNNVICLMMCKTTISADDFFQCEC